MFVDHRDAAAPPDALEPAPRDPGGPVDGASASRWSWPKRPGWPSGRPEWTARVVRAAGPGPGVLVMALGLLPMAAAVAQARDGVGSTAGQGLWLLGLAMVFAPAALGVFWPDLRSSTRLVLALAMAVLLQVSRLVLFPTRFTLDDELVHATVLRTLDRSGGFFGAGSVVPGASYHPGLEAVTSAVHSLSGLSVHASAVVVLLAARLLLALAVLLLITKLTSSVRIGSGAVVVYACQPGLVVVGSQFSSPTLAFPLAVLALYLTYRRREGGRLSFAPAMLATTTVALTDQLVTALLMIVLGLWFAAERLVCRRGDERPAGVMALFATGVLAATVFGPRHPDLVDASTSATSRGLFGDASQPWERGLVIASVVLTLTVLALALWQARRLLRVRIGPALVLIGLAAVYPLVLVGQVVGSRVGPLASVGAGVAGFVFLGVGFVVAWWVWQHEVRRWRAVALAVGATVVFLGSTILGTGSVSAQTAGSDRVSAAVRSPDADTLAAVDWLRTHLPAGRAVFADRTGGRVATTYGGEKLVDHLGSAADASRLLRDSTLGRGDRAQVQKRDIDYLVLDRRAASAPRKVTTGSGVQLVYDNGSIAIYDLEALDGRR